MDVAVPRVGGRVVRVYLVPGRSTVGRAEQRPLLHPHVHAIRITRIDGHRLGVGDVWRGWEGPLVHVGHLVDRRELHPATTVVQAPEQGHRFGAGQQRGAFGPVYRP